MAYSLAAGRLEQSYLSEKLPFYVPAMQSRTNTRKHVCACTNSWISRYTQAGSTCADVRACGAHAGNTWKEDAAAQYAHTFNRMFCNRYPHRRPLFLTARNEAGVSKLVRAH